MPRTTKKTPETIARVSESIEVGHTRKDACILAGISEDTFARWLKDDADFADEIAKSERVALDQSIKLVRKAAIDTWQAAAWWLERKHPDQFALRREITGAKGGPIELDGKTTVRHVILTPEAQAALEQSLKFALPEGDTILEHGSSEIADAGTDTPAAGA